MFRSLNRSSARTIWIWWRSLWHSKKPIKWKYLTMNLAETVRRSCLQCPSGNLRRLWRGSNPSKARNSSIGKEYVMRSRLRIALLLGFIITFLYAICASAAPECDSGSKDDCWDDGTEYAGTINDRYPIQMLLKRDGKDIKGYMFYESAAKYISLRGAVTQKDLATVNEMDEKGKITGVFEGDRDGKDIKGYMFYESAAKYISLRGAVTQKDLATVNEMDEKGKITGVFEAQ